MARILLIDDDASLLEALTLAFEDAGHTVAAARDGLSGLALVRSERPELVVSDVNMPGLDGFAICRKLRSEGNGVPMILLTARDSEIDEALGLELGADDYVSKPFSTRVLLARAGALLRRQELVGRQGGEEQDVTIGDLFLSPDRLRVCFRCQDVTVTVTEFRLLELLVRRPDAILSRDRILDQLRGDTVVDNRIVDTYIRRLRRKFEQIDPSFDGIETVVGAGYRWRSGA